MRIGIGFGMDRVARHIAVAAMACAFGAAACNQEAEKSEVSPTLTPGHDAEAPDMFEGLDSETCCERFCAAIADAGCGAADCVAEHCPVPDGLSEFDARQCKEARADVLCCAWQYVPQAACGAVGDARQAPECATVVSEADELCAAP